MNSPLRRAIIVATLLGTLGMAPPAAGANPVVNTIFPSSGSGGSFVIVVVSDGYVSARQADFNADAKFLFVTRLMNDGFYSAHKSSFTIKTVFNAAPAPGASLYGISSTPTNQASCNLSSDPPTTAMNINDAAVAADPNPQFVAVLFNNSVSFACTPRDHWTYVTSGAVDRRGIVAHEMGHLIAGLFDEWNDLHTAYSGDPVDRSNCSTKLAPLSPYWMALSLAAATSTPSNPIGCLYSVSGIVRPYQLCKMNDYQKDQPFCAICRREMEAAISDGAPPRLTRGTFQPPVLNERLVRLLISVNRITGQTSVLSANDVQGARIVQRRIGDYVYEISENGQTIATGVIAGDPFESRSYPRGDPKHTNERGDTATVVVLIPQATMQSLLSRSVQIRFYRLASSDPDAVTPDKLRRLLAADSAQSVAVVPSSALNDRLKVLLSR